MAPGCKRLEALLEGGRPMTETIPPTVIVEQNRRDIYCFTGHEWFVDHKIALQHATLLEQAQADCERLSGMELRARIERDEIGAQLERTRSALLTLLPFALEDYYPNCATPEFHAAVEAAKAACNWSPPS